MTLAGGRGYEWVSHHGGRMAQAEYLTGIHGSALVLLINDVMGQRDAKHRSGFLPLLESTCKAIGYVLITAMEEN